MTHNTYGIGYKERLERRRKKLQAIKDAAPKPPTLHERIEAWFAELSQEDQRRAWHMREFRAIFNDTPQRIGAALFELGWSRRRRWTDSKPTARYWFRV